MAARRRNMVHVLRSVFDQDNFKHANQRKAAAAIYAGGSDVCICIPPGTEESICYQLPAVMRKGKVTIVFSPKLSFLQNQAEYLKSKGIRTRLLTSRTGLKKKDAVFKDMISGSPSFKFLFCTVEVGAKMYFQTILTEMEKLESLAYIVFDEAHCLSLWGSNYRAYCRNIVTYRHQKDDALIPHTPMIALSTSSNSKVLDALSEILVMQNPRIYKMPMEQARIHYDVWFVETLSDPFEHLKDFILESLDVDDVSNYETERGVAVVYCREENLLETVKVKLKAFGLATLSYHPRKRDSVLLQVEDDWVSGEALVLTTTYNYGFIYKKPVRCVVHWTIPESLTKYYRESSEPKRDSDPIRCRMYVSMHEYSSVDFIITDYTAMNNAEFEEKQSQEFQKTMTYCLTAKCRHVLIAEYFGYIWSPCEKYCDVCLERSNVEQRTKEFVEYSQRVGVITYKLRDMNEELTNEREEIEIVFEQRKKPDVKPSSKRQTNHRKLPRNERSLQSNAKTAERARLNADNTRMEQITQSLLNKYNLNEHHVSLRPCRPRSRDSCDSTREFSIRPPVSAIIEELFDSSDENSIDLEERIRGTRGTDEVVGIRSLKTSLDTEVRGKSKKLRVSRQQERRSSLQQEILVLDGCNTIVEENTGAITGKDRVAGRPENVADEGNVEDETTAEYLMNKYRLNRDVITLEPRKSGKKRREWNSKERKTVRGSASCHHRGG